MPPETPASRAQAPVPPRQPAGRSRSDYHGGQSDSHGSQSESRGGRPAADRGAQQPRATGVLIEPRAQWPGGMLSLGIDLRGSIPVADRLEPGRALARLTGPSWTEPDWTEPDWGGPLRELFADNAPDTEASPAMMHACFRVLADWDWEARPVAVVSMPSRSRPRLVASVARGISRAGRMPLIGEVDVVELGPSGGISGPRAGAGGTASRASAGSDIETSAYRLADVYDRFAVGEQLADGLAAVAGHPILLVDDFVDSRWSITEAGRILRRNGAHHVLPFALALRG